MRLTGTERFQYRLAWALFWLLAFVAVFGPYLMPHQIDPAQKLPYQFIEVNGVRTMIEPPYAPDSHFWFGSEHRGLDVLSLLLNGARYTLGFALAVVVARFLIALPLGMYVGATGRLRSLLDSLASVTSAVPMLIILFPMFYGISMALQLNRGLEQNDPRIALFAQMLFLALVLLGVFPLAQQFAERARFFNGKLFITVSRSMGASTSRIVFKHLMPHLRPEVLFTFLTDFAQVLFIIGQLAVMTIFLGGGELLADADAGYSYLLTTTGEWGSMIAYGAQYIRVYPWIVTASACFLTASILILSNFSRQLQKRFARPQLYKSKPLLQNKPRLVLVAAATAVCLAVVTLLPNKAPNAIRTQAAQSGELGHDPSSEMMRTHMTKVAGEFIKLLARDNWGYAEAYINGKYGENLRGEYKMVEPFNLWLHALSKLGYQYQGVGVIKTAKGGQFENPYDVELLIQTPEGQTESWHLLMAVNPRARVLAGYGGPTLENGNAPVLLNEAERKQIYHETAAQFMQLLQANNWQEAAKLYGTGDPSAPVPEPFDRWLQAFQEQRYEFLETADPTRYYSLDNGEPIHVKVRNTQSGTTANWTVNLLMSPDGQTAHVVAGRGIPAK